MDKIKAMFKRFAAYVRGPAMVAAMACLGMMSAFAAEPDSATASSLLSNAGSTISGDMISVATAVFPAFLGVFALVMGVRFGIKFLKNLFGKA